MLTAAVIILLLCIFLLLLQFGEWAIWIPAVFQRKGLLHYDKERRGRRRRRSLCWCWQLLKKVHIHTNLKID